MAKTKELVLRTNWFEFYPKFGKLRFTFSPASYFDSRWFISLCLGWGQLYLYLPIRSKIDECEYPSYGFYFYGEGKWWDSLWLCYGYKVKCIHMPWSLDWVRTSNLRRDGHWEHETKGNRKDFWEEKWTQIIHHETHPYTYILRDGTIQNTIATVKVVEREWRPRWFKWTSIFAKVVKSIDVSFASEVGEGTGSWKGGVTGCGHQMLPSECALDTLRRMEKEIKFNR